jgi:nitrogen fixation/metabolism regulation signal transduction histidine kinase
MTTPSTPTTKIAFLGLRLKLLLTFSALFTLVFAATYYWFFQYSTSNALKKIQDDQIATITGAAEQIDAEALLGLYHDGQPNADGFSDDPRYAENMAVLERIHQIEPRAYSGTYVLDANGSLVFLTDLWANYDVDRAATFLYVCEPVACAEGDADTAKAIEQATTAIREGKVELKEGIVEDQWGRWSSAWAPIRDSSGNVVAGMFLDFEAAYVDEVQRQVETQIAIAAVISYLIVFVMVYIVSSQLTRPVVELTKAAERIGEGDYNQDLTHLTQVGTRDEISTMADVFQIMVGKVYQREQTLIRQVQELKIEIDETKRKTQVSEIVDSEFFQELQEKSRAMRRRRASGEYNNDPAPEPSPEPKTSE